MNKTNSNHCREIENRLASAYGPDFSPTLTKIPHDAYRNSRVLLPVKFSSLCRRCSPETFAMHTSATYHRSSPSPPCLSPAGLCTGTIFAISKVLNDLSDNLLDSGRICSCPSSLDLREGLSSSSSILSSGWILFDHQKPCVIPLCAELTSKSVGVGLDRILQGTKTPSSELRRASCFFLGRWAVGVWQVWRAAWLRECALWDEGNVLQCGILSQPDQKGLRLKRLAQLSARDLSQRARQAFDAAPWGRSCPGQCARVACRRRNPSLPSPRKTSLQD